MAEVLVGTPVRDFIAMLSNVRPGGDPSRRLAAVLERMERPAIRDLRTACSKDRIPWHCWPTRGNYSLFLESWAALPVHEKTEVWRGDLRDIAALAASMSDLSGYATLDDFAEHCCPDWIKDVSEHSLSRRLEGSELKVPMVQLIRYAWDGRVFAVNSNGSHHLATARYIAGKLHRPVPISAPLTEWRLDAAAIANLTAKRALFAIAENTAPEFYQALRRCGAAYEVGDLPGAPLRMGSPSLDGIRLVELNTESRHGSAAAELMRTKGFFDVGLHVLQLAQGQSDISEGYIASIE